MHPPATGDSVRAQRSELYDASYLNVSSRPRDQIIGGGLLAETAGEKIQGKGYDVRERRSGWGLARR